MSLVMSNDRPGRPAEIELAFRKTWALNRVGELINAGRKGGWLAGDESVPTIDGHGLLQQCEELLGGASTPMRALARGCQLEARDADALWLLACIELEPRVTRAATLLRSSDNDPSMTVQLLERAVLGDRPSSQSAAVFLERLRGFRLVESSVDPAIPLQRRMIRVGDRVLDLARGVMELERNLESIATLDECMDGAEPLDAALTGALAANSNTVVMVSGVSMVARMDCIRAAMTAARRRMILVRGESISNDKVVGANQLRAIARECLLHNAVPVIDGVDHVGERLAVIERELIGRLEGVAIACADGAVALSGDRPVVGFHAMLPDAAARAENWRRAIPHALPDLVAHCASSFPLPASTIAHVGASVACATSGATVTVTDVLTALRADVESKLAGAARRVVVTQTWDDLVLPAEEFDLLLELCGRVRYRDQVLDEWGFANKVGRGTGITALMSGPPGTGKTMIAGLLANELGLDLYQIDLSKIVSKYIGETEKQLAAVFDAAESGHAVILFDEADSLFGKRTEVKSSNDRYANLETNFLLQRIESFTGIAILTTNHESAIDPAFKRRLTTHIRVPTPERAQREELWKAMMPKQADVSGELDFKRLAGEFEMTGGYIKNATLRAAFLAAAERKPISTNHLLRAARAEYQGMGRIALG